MRVFNQTEKLAFAQRFPASGEKRGSESWSLYYGSNKTAWYGPAPYSHCVAEQNRLMEAGHGYKKELFKIK